MNGMPVRRAGGASRCRERGKRGCSRSCPQKTGIRWQLAPDGGCVRKAGRENAAVFFRGFGCFFLHDGCMMAGDAGMIVTVGGRIMVLRVYGACGGKRSFFGKRCGKPVRPVAGLPGRGCLPGWGRDYSSGEAVSGRFLSLPSRSLRVFCASASPAMAAFWSQ